MSDHPEIVVETSPDLASLAKALPKAQASMGEVFKSATNPAFRSKYADLSAVVEAVVPALNANGFSLIQPSAGLTGDVVPVATMLLHESGEWIRCTVRMPVGKRDAHGVGSAITYARRYGLQAMSGVAPEDDDGNAASRPRDSNVREVAGPAITQDQADELEALAEEVGADKAKFLRYVGFESFAAIPAARLSQVREALEAKRQKAAA